MTSVTFPSSLGGDNSTVTDDSNPSTGLANGGHRARFVPALAQTVAVMNGGITAAQTQVSLAAAQVALAAGQVALATTQANNSATSAANAAMSAGATVWVSGTTYAIGDTRYSPITNQIYRRKTAGAGTTDPSADSTNWALVMLDAVTNYPTIKPSLNLDFANTKTLDPRITFSRASTATYYDGKTFAKAEENLLSYSQEFDNAAWLKYQVTCTGNATTSPDGVMSADTIIPDTNTNRHFVYQRYVTAKAGEVFAFSCYAKANGYNFIALGFEANNSGVTASCIFDLTNGTSQILTNIGGSFSNLSSVVNSIGSGWYRVSIIATSIATLASFLTCQIGPSDSFTPAIGAGMPSFTGDGTSGIYIWGAQLEQRSSATAYTPTTSQPITNYIPVLQTAAANTPRFDHNPTTGESLGLLIEEQRTNLLLRSQEFDNAAWGKNSVTVTANQVVAPDGSISGDLLAGSSGVNDFILYAPTTASGTVLCFSFFIKNRNASVSRLMFRTAATAAAATINWSGSQITSIVSYGGEPLPTSYGYTDQGNGWYRVYAVATTTETNQNVRIFPDGNNTYKEVYIWGAQLEAGSFPTSYIPTTTAQVTRSADAASMTGSNFSSWYRQDEGTIFIENNYNHGGTDDGKTALHVDNAAGSRFMLHNSGSLNRLVVTVNNTEVVSISGATPASKSFVKTAFAIKTNDFASSSNAANASVDTSGNVPIVSAMRLGTYESPGYELNGHIKRIAFWQKRLSNIQLQSLTV
jgi:hypothetical protein